MMYTISEVKSQHAEAVKLGLSGGLSWMREKVGTKGKMGTKHDGADNTENEKGVRKDGLDDKITSMTTT